MNINEYLEPVGLDKPGETYISFESQFGSKIQVNTPSEPVSNLSNYDIAILGVPEDRNSLNKGSSLAPDIIRAELYQLSKIHTKATIIDLGNLKEGNTFNDTYHGLRDVITELLNNQIVIIILGGTQDLTYPVYQAHEKQKQLVNIVTIDSRLDIDPDNKKPFNSLSYLNKLLLDKKSKLFNFTNIGHQQYLVDPKNIDLINHLHHEATRLGVARNNMSIIEPHLRDADIVSFDIGAIKKSDAPANRFASPNGFYSEEACQIARYAGLSDVISTFGIFEVNPKFEDHFATAQLAAQLSWHFIEGFTARKIEVPGNKKDFKTFIVGQENMGYEITFYKSLVTDRWWMEIPSTTKKEPVFMACSNEEYKQACNHEIPDLWWKAFQKLS
jgi:formiminoglutamase